MERERSKIIEEPVYRAIAEASPLAFIVWIPEDFGIIDWNKSAERIFGWKKEEVVGKNLFEFLIPKDGRKEIESVRKRVKAGEISNYSSTWSLTKQGKLIRCEWYNIALKEKDGGLVVLSIVRDITDYKEVEKKLIYMATHDTLTGLLNRASFFNRLNIELSYTSRIGKRLTVMILDIDWFKKVNDLLGHNIGDKLLQAVARRIKKVLRKTDIIARMGGDEFMILLPDIERKEDAEEVAKKILESVREIFIIDNYKLSTTVSIGIAFYPEHGEDEERLMLSADKAMYEAKRSGRNRYVVYNPGENRFSR